jgi:HPt (histidine-containing phosphotransfer) domain-containing protein
MQVSIQLPKDGSEFNTQIREMLAEYGDEEFCLSLIEVFIRDGATTLERLRSSVESGDRKKSYAAAHSLKNMLGVLRSAKGVELAERVCIELNADSPGPSIHELLGLTAQLLEACRALVAASKTA